MNDTEILRTLALHTVLLEVVLGLKIFIFMCLFGLFTVIIRGQRRQEELMILQKEWATIGRDQHTDAKKVMDKVDKHTDELHHTSEIVTQKTEEVKLVVEKVPERVIEKIKQENDGLTPFH